MAVKTFCVFCSLPIKVYGKKHVHVTELAVFSMVSIIFTYLVWGEFHFIGLVLFTLLTMMAELVHRTRWRSSVNCRGCGFDPILYKNNPSQVASNVKEKLAHRKLDPLYMLKPQPKITPIIRKVKNYRPPAKTTALQSGPKDLQ